MSNPGFPLNVNDITGITRGDEVTVNNDLNMFPLIPGSLDRYYPSSGQSPSPGNSYNFGRPFDNNENNFSK